MSDLEKHLDRVTEQLVRDFVDRIDSRAIEEEVRRAAAEFTAARVTQYVPVLVSRTARERLHALAH